MTLGRVLGLDLGIPFDSDDHIDFPKGGRHSFEGANSGFDSVVPPQSCLTVNALRAGDLNGKWCCIHFGFCGNSIRINILLP